MLDASLSDAGKYAGHRRGCEDDNGKVYGIGDVKDAFENRHAVEPAAGGVDQIQSVSPPFLDKGDGDAVAEAGGTARTDNRYAPGFEERF